MQRLQAGAFHRSDTYAGGRPHMGGQGGKLYSPAQWLLIRLGGT
jgi:hypothetical protein